MGGHREGAQRPERGGAEDREAGLVEPGQQRGLAVHHGVVEHAAVGEHPGLGGQEALVGAPDRADEGRQVGEQGDQGQQRHQPRPVTRPHPLPAVGRGYPQGQALGERGRAGSGGGRHG